MKCLACCFSHFAHICMRLGWLRGDRYNLSDMLKVPSLSGKKFTCQKLHIPILLLRYPHPPNLLKAVFTHRLNLYLSRKMFLSSSSLPFLSLILFSSSAIHKATLNVSNWGKNAPILYFTSSFTSNSQFLSKLSQLCLFTSPHHVFLPSLQPSCHHPTLLSIDALSLSCSHPLISVQAPTHLLSYSAHIGHELLLKPADRERMKRWGEAGHLWEEMEKAPWSSCSSASCRVVFVVRC